MATVSGGMTDSSTGVLHGRGHTSTDTLMHIGTAISLFRTDRSYSKRASTGTSQHQHHELENA
jgi:hypothetical protein